MSRARAPDVPGSRRPLGLAGRLMLAQILVITLGEATLVVVAELTAPAIFRNHLLRAGDATPQVQRHVEEAFAAAFGIALVVATAGALLTAGLVSWYLVRRVSRPIEALADAADLVAAGRYRVSIPGSRSTPELDRLSAAFRHMADRLAASEAVRGRLLADLAHELRTPLATLEAYIDGIEDAVVPAQESSWSTMRAQVSRLRRLAGDLREVSAAEEHALDLAVQPVDPRSVADAAVAAASPRYVAKGVRLELVAPAGLPSVPADPQRMAQVLANLLDNALRHTPPAGHVQVEVAAQGRSVVYTVADDGEGIPGDQLDEVFTRFHRVDPARAGVDDGSGLGLTIARAIVTAHGGSITAHSEGPGRGASLRVTLPVVAG